MDSITKRYHKETGLHSHYVRAGWKGKRELTYTRKYVWWLEKIIKDANNCIACTRISSPLEAAENTYKILNGE